LVKCGVHYPRYYLVETADCVRTNTAQFKDYYNKKYRGYLNTNINVPAS